MEMRVTLGGRHTALIVAALLVTNTATGATESKDEDKRSRLPAAVVKAIDANCPGAEIAKLDIESEEGIKVYDIEFKDARGEIDVLEDGTVLNVATIVEMKEVPEPAAAVILKAARGTTIKQLEKSEVRARIEKKDGKGRLFPLPAPEYEYEAEFAKGGEIEVAADGRIIKAPKSMSKGTPSGK
jgi:hypothetical protein